MPVARGMGISPMLASEEVPKFRRKIRKIWGQTAASCENWMPDTMIPNTMIPILLKYPCWAAPVISRGLLYVRGADRLVCLELIPGCK